MIHRRPRLTPGAGGRRRSWAGRLDEVEPLLDRGRAGARPDGGRAVPRVARPPVQHRWPTSRRRIAVCRADLARAARRRRAPSGVRPRRAGPRRPSRTSCSARSPATTSASPTGSPGGWRPPSGAGRGRSPSGSRPAQRDLVLRGRASTSAPSSRPRGGWARRCAPTSGGSRSRRARGRRRRRAWRTSGWPRCSTSATSWPRRTEHVTAGIEQCRRLAYAPPLVDGPDHARPDPAGRGRPGGRARRASTRPRRSMPQAVVDPRLPLPALRAELALAAATSPRRRAGSRAHGLAADDEPVYLREPRVPGARPGADRRAATRGRRCAMLERWRALARRPGPHGERAAAAGAGRRWRTTPRGDEHRGAAGAGRGARARRAGGLPAGVPRRGRRRSRRCCASCWSAAAWSSSARGRGAARVPRRPGRGVRPARRPVRAPAPRCRGPGWSSR